MPNISWIMSFQNYSSPPGRKHVSLILHCHALLHVGRHTGIASVWQTLSWNKFKFLIEERESGRRTLVIGTHYFLVEWEKKSAGHHTPELSKWAEIPIKVPPLISAPLQFLYPSDFCTPGCCLGFCFPEAKAVTAHSWGCCVFPISPLTVMDALLWILFCFPSYVSYLWQVSFLNWRAELSRINFTSPVPSQGRSSLPEALCGWLCSAWMLRGTQKWHDGIAPSDKWDVCGRAHHTAVRVMWDWDTAVATLAPDSAHILNSTPPGSGLLPRVSISELGDSVSLWWQRLMTAFATLLPGNICWSNGGSVC